MQKHAPLPVSHRLKAKAVGKQCLESGVSRREGHENEHQVSKALARRSPESSELWHLHLSLEGREGREPG